MGLQESHHGFPVWQPGSKAPSLSPWSHICHCPSRAGGAGQPSQPSKPTLHPSCEAAPSPSLLWAILQAGLLGAKVALLLSHPPGLRPDWLARPTGPRRRPRLPSSGCRRCRRGLESAPEPEAPWSLRFLGWFGSQDSGPVRVQLQLCDLISRATLGQTSLPRKPGGGNGGWGDTTPSFWSSENSGLRVVAPSFSRPLAPHSFPLQANSQSGPPDRGDGRRRCGSPQSRDPL